MVYLFTDGYQDQFGGPYNHKFMKSKLRELLVKISKLDTEEQKQVLDDEFQRWKGEEEQTDDLLIIGLKL